MRINRFLVFLSATTSRGLTNHMHGRANWSRSCKWFWSNICINRLAWRWAKITQVNSFIAEWILTDLYSKWVVGTFGTEKLKKIDDEPHFDGHNFQWLTIVGNYTVSGSSPRTQNLVYICQYYASFINKIFNWSIFPYRNAPKKSFSSLILTDLCLVSLHDSLFLLLVIFTHVFSV